MTVFSITWNATFNTLPPDTENASNGASRIREFKTAVYQRLGVDHSFAGDANDGKHLHSTLMVQSADPTLDPTDGAIYSKSVGGVTELFYENSSAQVTQLTNAGSINANVFPSGTTMLFLQASAPPGWTQVPALNDLVIRAVNDASGGSTGGSWTISGVTVAGHALTISELPSHSHGITSGAVVFDNQGSTIIPGGTGYGGETFIAQGGNTAHTHGWSNDATWRPAYVNSLVGKKN